MSRHIVLTTTKRRHKKIFDRYLELLQKEYENDPEKAISLSKSYFYKQLSDEFDLVPHVIGRIVQLGFQEKGSPPNRRKKALDPNEMDPQVRFILGYKK